MEKSIEPTSITTNAKPSSSQSHPTILPYGHSTIPYKVILTFESVDEILKCGHTNESYEEVLFCGAVYYTVQGGSNF